MANVDICKKHGHSQREALKQLIIKGKSRKSIQISKSSEMSLVLKTAAGFNKLSLEEIQNQFKGTADWKVIASGAVHSIPITEFRFKNLPRVAADGSIDFASHVKKNTRGDIGGFTMDETDSRLKEEFRNRYNELLQAGKSELEAKTAIKKDTEFTAFTQWLDEKAEIDVAESLRKAIVPIPCFIARKEKPYMCNLTAFRNLGLKNLQADRQARRQSGRQADRQADILVAYVWGDSIRIALTEVKNITQYPWGSAELPDRQNNAKAISQLEKDLKLFDSLLEDLPADKLSFQLFSAFPSCKQEDLEKIFCSICMKSVINQNDTSSPANMLNKLEADGPIPTATDEGKELLLTLVSRLAGQAKKDSQRCLSEQPETGKPGVQPNWEGGRNNRTRSEIPHAEELSLFAEEQLPEEYDEPKAKKPKAPLFPSTKADNLPEVSNFSGWENKKYFKKEYQCAIDADFPDNEVDKKYLKERVTKLILASTQSSIDLDFVKELILVEHTQEIASLEFEELILKQLPWSSLVFDILDIKKGSTIIEFHLGFQEPPQNESDLNTYRLIELVVITIIENLQFIKSIREFKTNRKEESLVLSAKVEAHLFDESVIKQTISSLRGSLSFIVSETDTADDQVETFLLDLFEQKPDEFMKLTNLDLTPVSMRRIITVLKDSKLTDRDVANVTIELDTSIKKNKCALVKADTNFLFPYNFRKLADLEPQVFKLMLKSTRDLPKEKELWYKFFLYNLDMFEVGDIRKLSKEVDADWPYPDILDEYKDHGGTLGGLVQALEKFEEEVEGAKEKQNIAKFLEIIKNLREEVYEDLIENIFCPSQCPSVQNFEDFQKMARNQGLKIKTNPMQSFKTLQRSLIPGDQLWIFHARPQMRTYAHVVIITEALKFIHVTAPKRLHLKLILRSKIKEENQYKLIDEKFCFVVRPAVPIEGDPNLFSKRALCCCGILFDYDPETANCETFCNGVHGIWKPSVQGQDLRGVAQNAANAFSKLVIKRRNEALTSQMQRRFQEQQMILPKEIFE